MTYTNQPNHDFTENIVEQIQTAQQLSLDDPERHRIILILITWAYQNHRHRLTRNLSNRLIKFLDQALENAENSLNKSLNNLKVDFENSSYQQIENTFLKLLQVIISRRCIDLSRGKQPTEISINDIISYESDTSREETIPDRNPDPMQTLIQNDQNENIQKFIQYLKDDPDQELTQYFPNHKKQRNYTAKEFIVCYLLLQKTFDRIAQEYSTPTGTVRSDWRRYLKELVQKKAENFGII